MADVSTTTLEWRRLSRRAAFESHRLVGWIYWDPNAIDNYVALGVENPAGYYIATRAASLADAGNDVVVAAFYSIHPGFVAHSLDECRRHTTFEAAAGARDAAVVAGLQTHVPEVCEELAGLAGSLWSAADSLPLGGRPLFASLLRRRCEHDPLLSAWLAVNCIREWRGDTHWAIHAAEGIGPVEAGVLDGGWRSYGDDWLPRSRGADDAEISAAYESLSTRGLVTDGRVNERGIAFRQALEDRLDDLATAAWRHLGADVTAGFVELLEPVSERLLDRIDRTAGDKWMPAGRRRPPADDR